MLRKISLLLPHLFYNVEFEFSWFHNTKQSSEILILKRENQLKFQNSRILKLLNRFVKHRLFRRLEDVFKTSSRHVFKMSSAWQFFVIQDVFKTYLQDKKLLRWRRVEDFFKTCLEDIFKTSWRPTKYLLVWGSWIIHKMHRKALALESLFK